MKDRDAAQALGQFLTAPPEEDTPEEVEDSADDFESEDPQMSVDEDFEDAEEPEQDEVEPERHIVRVDGEEVEVTYDELLAGYSRHGDYTRKSQELAEQRRALETEREQSRQDRERYAELVPRLRQTLEQLTTPAKPDINLLDTNPSEYYRQKAAYDEAVTVINEYRAEEERIAKERQAEQHAQMQRQLQTEQQMLVKARPEWKDDTKRTEALSRIKAYAQAIGVSEAELADVWDHRFLLALDDAARFHALQSKGKKAAQSAKTAKPGTAQVGTNKRRQHKKLRERALQPGAKERDIAPLMGKLLTGT